MPYESLELKKLQASYMGSDKRRRPIKVLQVVNAMERAGLETWLMYVLRNIDREQFQIDFLVSVPVSGHYDNEIRQLGGRVLPCLYPKHPWIFGSAFKRILHQYGPYDVVHSHIHHYSGYILCLAKQANVPVRIAHSHVDSSWQESKAGILRQLYLDLMKSWIHRYATAGLGCSREAATDLFGSGWETDPRWQIIYYGIDLSPFQTSVDRAAVRKELGIPETSFVLGHVGRFFEQKNHRFLIAIFEEVTRRIPDTYLLLVGDGTLKPEIEQLVRQIGLVDRVIFTGSRSDVPTLMRGAMDAFIMPSFYEGLPVSAIEAQAANLPLILSDSISQETDYIKPLIQRVKLTQSLSDWVDSVEKVYKDLEFKRTQSTTLENSPFNIINSINKLEAIYATQ